MNILEAKKIICDAGYLCSVQQRDREFIVVEDERRPSVWFCPWAGTWFWPDGQHSKVQEGDVYKFLEWYGERGE